MLGTNGAAYGHYHSDVFLLPEFGPFLCHISVDEQNKIIEVYFVLATLYDKRRVDLMRATLLEHNIRSRALTDRVVNLMP
jgi:hypothetical protein